MISTELVTRVLLTVMIVGAVSIDLCGATNVTTKSLEPNTENKKDDEDSSLDSPVSPSSSSPSTMSVGDESLQAYDTDDGPQSRLLRDSAESGILLPFDEDFPRPGGNPLPSSVSFSGKPLSLRITSGKALEQPKGLFEKDYGKFIKNDDKSTYYVRNNCFGPRCPNQLSGKNFMSSTSSNPLGDWQTVYYDRKDLKAKKYDGGRQDNSLIGAATRYEDNVMMEGGSSNIHSQLQIPFVVVDPSKSSFSKRLGLDRYSRMTTSESTPISPEGWIKLKAISPDAYDPFRFSKNTSKDTFGHQSTFTKRDSSSATGSNNFSKRVGVELNPESFADRWGWSADGNDKRGGSRLPSWLEEQLQYGNRNQDQGKNWVKLDPIPVAGVTISKWVPKGTAVSDLPTTSWQANRDRPNGGSPWWDRVDDTRILTGARPGGTAFLRPESSGGGGGGGDMGWGSKGSGGGSGSPLSSFDRYPTNSWNDIIYPEGPTSATVSWQQNKNGISSNPSSFSVSGNGATVGWTAPGHDSVRKPIVATGSWTAPQNNRFPSFINRFNDHRPTSSYPVKQSSENDPRWVLISNTRRVTSGSGPNYGNRRQDYPDRSKILQYINRLHPDLDRRTDFPFYESPSKPTNHRNGKDFWQWPFQGTLSSSTVVYPSKDEAFRRVNDTLSTLTPVLVHRGGPTVTPEVGNNANGGPFRLGGIFSDDDNNNSNDSGDGNSSGGTLNDIITVSSTLPPHLSTYIGDGRATSSNVQTFLQPTSTTVRNTFPGRFKLGLQNINPVYAAVGAGMIPATLAAVMPMMLGKRRRRDLSIFRNRPRRIQKNNGSNNFLYSRRILY